MICFSSSCQRRVPSQTRVSAQIKCLSAPPSSPLSDITALFLAAFPPQSSPVYFGFKMLRLQTDAVTQNALVPLVSPTRNEPVWVCDSFVVVVFAQCFVT